MINDITMSNQESMLNCSTLEDEFYNHLSFLRLPVRVEVAPPIRDRHDAKMTAVQDTSLSYTWKHATNALVDHVQRVRRMLLRPRPPLH